MKYHDWKCCGDRGHVVPAEEQPGDSYHSKNFERWTNPPPQQIREPVSSRMDDIRELRDPDRLRHSGERIRDPVLDIRLELSEISPDEGIEHEEDSQTDKDGNHSACGPACPWCQRRERLRPGRGNHVGKSDNAEHEAARVLHKMAPPNARPAPRSGPSPGRSAMPIANQSATTQKNVIGMSVVAKCDD